MRILAIIAMLMSGLFADHANAENEWKPPTSLANCETANNSIEKKECKRFNFCIESSTEACLAYVGNTGEDQHRGGLLHGCFDEKMFQCENAVVYESTSRSTNFSNNPDAWDCIYNPGKKPRVKQGLLSAGG